MKNLKDEGTYRRFQRLPAVLRIALALLLSTATFGQWWQRQPAGAGTELVLSIVAAGCPPAAVHVAEPVVADGARALDRWAYRALANQLGGDGQDRCRG